MRKVWFGYTATSFEGKGSPGIYYDDLPNEKNYLHRPFLSPPVLLPADTPMTDDGEVAMSFAQLIAQYPPPAYTAPAKMPLDIINRAIFEDAMQQAVEDTAANQAIG